MRRITMIGFFVMLTLSAQAAPLGYAFRTRTAAPDSLEVRFPAPAGFVRVAAEKESFGAWLRTLPLEPPNAPVLLFDGRAKPRQDVHAAVVAIDIGTRDLQQCADAIMRLYAEYEHAKGVVIEFHPGPRQVLRFDPREPDPGRQRFRRYLTRVFSEAGSASLQAELAPVTDEVKPGDVLIQGGHPGHAILVLDVAAGERGHRRVLLGQSYMPAQSFHVLKGADGSWFDAEALASDAGLVTPEWRPFHRADVRRFR